MPESVSRPAQAFGKLPLSFEANKGQVDDRVKFLARSSGYTLFLTPDAAVLSLQMSAELPSSARERNTSRPPTERIRRPEQSPATATLRMQLIGANRKATISGAKQLPGKSNYFIGADPRNWTTGVPHYSEVKYAGVYPGVDLVYYGNQGQLEYDFVVAPAGDPREIVFDISQVSDKLNGPADGGTPVRIDHDGDLVVALRGGEIRFHKPIAYQADTHAGQVASDVSNRQFVEAHYVVKSRNRVGLEIAAYDTTRTLVIDPVLAYSSYVGGSSVDTGDGIALDRSGNIYITGYTNSMDFPRVHQIRGACKGNCGTGADYDVFVTKINAAGDTLIYSSYIGGGKKGKNSADYGSGIAVDASGNAYVTGLTDSENFPRVKQIPGACNGSCGSGSNWDSFVLKINASGDALVYSSLIGGSGNDQSSYITVDKARNAIVTGFEGSKDFPQVNQISGACHGTCGSGANYDGFVVKINTAGDGLAYSTLIGGSGDDKPLSIAFDRSGSLYVTGLTFSSDFPVVSQIPGACQGSCGKGGSTPDAFLTKINSTESTLVYSSFIGGSGWDDAEGVVLDRAGNAYLAGTTLSADFPRVNQIPGVCVGNCGTGKSADVFVTGVNAAGSSLLYSSYIGGDADDDASGGLAMDGAGNLYVNGSTTSANYPRVHQIAGACRGLCGTGAGEDVFVTEINGVGSSVLYSTYLGGSGWDVSGIWEGIAVDKAGNAYLTGYTASSDFPILNQIPGACEGTCGNGLNDEAFVAKISHK